MKVTGRVGRVSGRDELARWIAWAEGRGADRSELWQKTRGSAQERVHVGAASEPLKLADELLARVEADRRVELGMVSYAVFAYRGEDKMPVERAFFARAAPVVAIPAPAERVGGGAAEQNPGTQREVFGLLPREDAHERRANGAMARASAGTFETFAKGYERTLGDVQMRLENALQEAASLRNKNEALEREKKELAAALEELRRVSAHDELAGAERRARLDPTAAEILKITAPVVLAKLTDMPLDTATLEPLFAAFLDTITDEQIPTVLEAFRTSQKVFVMKLLKAHRAIKKRPPRT